MIGDTQTPSNVTKTESNRRWQNNLSGLKAAIDRINQRKAKMKYITLKRFREKAVEWTDEKKRAEESRIIEINVAKYDKQTKKAKRVWRGWSLKQRQRKGETKWETELDDSDDTNSEDEKGVGRDVTEEEEYATNVEEEEAEEIAEEEEESGIEENTEEEVDCFGEKKSPYDFNNEDHEG
jgi:hypothetical protein